MQMHLCLATCSNAQRWCACGRAQVFNMILPRVNVRRQAAWYKDGELPDMSPVDAQARLF